MEYSNKTGLDEIYKLNSIANPDKYLYFCHLKNIEFIDEIEVVDPITGETKMKEKLLIDKIRVAEIGNFLHHYLLPEDTYKLMQEYQIYGSYDFLSSYFSYFKFFTDVKNYNPRLDKLYAIVNFGDEKGFWRIPRIAFSNLMWQIRNIREKIGSANLCEVLKEHRQYYLFSVIDDELTETEKLYLEV